jgi:hypothetical protein
MSQLYLVEYGCSQCSEHLVVSAGSKEAAEEYAYYAAQECWDSYSHDDYYDETDEWADEDCYEEMQYDIFYNAVEFDPTNEIHADFFEEQAKRPHVV